MSVSDQPVADADVASPEADVEPSADDESPDAAETDATQASSSLPLDQMFEILKNERRRTVLHYLNDHEGPVALGDLAEHVAAVENDTTVPQVTSRERKCVYVGLYQCHLPKMDDMDIVEFNQNRGRIELGPNAAQLRQYLERSEQTERPWPAYYGGVAAAGLVLVALTQAVAGGTALALGACALSLVAVGALAVTDLRSDAETAAFGRWAAELLGR